MFCIAQVFQGNSFDAEIMRYRQGVSQQMENESRGKHKQNISFLRCTAMHRKQTNDLFFLQNLSVAFANFFYTFDLLYHAFLKIAIISSTWTGMKKSVMM